MNDKNATHTTGMSDAAKEARQAYYKAWRAKNKEGGETQCSQTY